MKIVQVQWSGDQMITLNWTAFTIIGKCLNLNMRFCKNFCGKQTFTGILEERLVRDIDSVNTRKQ